MKIRIQSLIFGLFAVLLAHSVFAADSDKTIQIVESYVKAWNEHDALAASQFLDDSVEFLDMSVGTPVVGRKNAKEQIIETFIKAVPDCRWEIVGEPVVDGDSVAFEWKFSGTNSGAWSAETPATQRKLAYIGVSVIRISDGKIAHQRDYYDVLGFNKQLGW